MYIVRLWSMLVLSCFINVSVEFKCTVTFESGKVVKALQVMGDLILHADIVYSHLDIKKIDRFRFTLCYICDLPISTEFKVTDLFQRLVN